MIGAKTVAVTVVATTVGSGNGRTVVAKVVVGTVEFAKAPCLLLAVELTGSWDHNY